MSMGVRLGASPQQKIVEQGKILCREEAKSRLRQLTPDMEEFCQLQKALIGAAGIAEVNLPTHSYKVDSLSQDCVMVGGFGSSEHVAIGEAVELKGLEKNTPLIVKGATSVRFQHILALAGDFYGIAGEAISLPGGTDVEKTQRFKNAFETLAQADNNELRRVILEIEHECTDVRNSSLPHHCYSSQLMQKNSAIKKIKSDINELLIDNSDHFSTHAEDAYQIGHAYALRVARDAGKRKDIEGLKQSYALDGYACHFLTDLFASGHSRNQRGKLEVFLITQLKFSPGLAKKLAGILTGAQHEKDGKEGLNVANGKGEHWRAYGDGSFFTPKNKENKEKAIGAVQQSVDEIYAAYIEGESPEEKVEPISIVDQLIPHATDYNPPPLYSIEGNSLFLNQGSETIPIKNRFDYITAGISLAIRHLPEDYISGFIIADLRIEFPEVVEKIKGLMEEGMNKVVIPQIERVTGAVWHVIGIATYYQVKQANQQLNEKIDEMADELMASYNASQEILRQMQQLKVQVDQLVWNDLSQEINEPVAKIKDYTHELKIHPKAAIDPERLRPAQESLWNAYVRMSRIFHDGAVDGKNILAAYASMLASREQSMTPIEIKVATTLWFRQMLDYQTKAFALSVTLKFMRTKCQADEVQKQVSELQISLTKQIEANKSHIDELLIFESRDYIALQLEKSKTKRLVLGHLNASK